MEMQEQTIDEPVLEKNKRQADRMAKSEAARERRRSVKDVVFERTQKLYSKMRKLRKNNNRRK